MDLDPAMAQIPIERRLGDPQRPADLLDRVATLAMRVRPPRRWSCARRDPGGRPPLRPRALTAARPARVRSTMRPRSNSASAAQTRRRAAPASGGVDRVRQAPRPAPLPPIARRPPPAPSAAGRAGRASRRPAHRRAEALRARGKVGRSARPPRSFSHGSALAAGGAQRIPLQVEVLLSLSRRAHSRSASPESKETRRILDKQNLHSRTSSRDTSASFRTCRDPSIAPSRKSRVLWNRRSASEGRGAFPAPLADAPGGPKPAGNPEEPPAARLKSVPARARELLTAPLRK